MPMIKFLINQYLNEKVNSNKHVLKTVLDWALVIFAFIVATYLNWQLELSLLFAFTAWIIINPIKSANLFKVAYICLLIMPILLLVKRPEGAELLSILAFYFLLLALWRLYSEGSGDK